MKTIAVTQQPTQSDVQVYFNDFDKTAVSSDTELSGTDAWNNEDPAVIGNYSYSGVLVSADTPSSGSGANNIFFNQVSYFQTPAISVNTSSAQNYVLTFSIYADTFDKNAFEVYLSGDGNNWLKVDYDVDGASGWMNASASFKILGTPTTSMYLYFATSEPGKYRIDDVKLANTAAQQQNIIRFPGEIQFGGTKEVSVEQFLAEKPNLMYKYSLTGKVTAVNGEDVTISDNEGTTTVVLKSLDLNGLAETLGEGDEVTVVGYRNVAEDGTACMSDGVLEEYTKAGSGEEAATGDELIISEVVVGSTAGNVYIEIYNPSSTAKSLSSYVINVYDKTGRKLTIGSSIGYSNLNPGDTFVYSSNSQSLWTGTIGKEDWYLDSFTGGYIELLSEYGRYVKDVAGSKDNPIEAKTIRRKLNVGQATTVFNISEWDEYPVNTIDGLGKR